MDTQTTGLASGSPRPPWRGDGGVWFPRTLSRGSTPGVLSSHLFSLPPKHTSHPISRHSPLPQVTTPLLIPISPPNSIFPKSTLSITESSQKVAGPAEHLGCCHSDVPWSPQFHKGLRVSPLNMPPGARGHPTLKTGGSGRTGCLLEPGTLRGCVCPIMIIGTANGLAP